MGTLANILKDNWEWRGQIWRLSLFEVKKQNRGAVFGWIWFLVRPMIYIFCFWFAIEIGMRAARTTPGDAPYILWLSSGIVPWFFMQSMLGGGIDVFTKFSYLVKKVKFPYSSIVSIFVLSTLLIQFIQASLLVVIYIACGQGLDPYLLQVPLLYVIMAAFWWFFSLLISPLSAMSRDMKNLLGALSTPFFWLSGVLFNVQNIGNQAIQVALLFNPITFIVTGFRDALYSKTWIWEDPTACACFGVVFLITATLALVVYRRTGKVVADVL